MNDYDYNGYREWKSWSSLQFGLYSSEDALYYSSECNRCGFSSINGISILEIGFGNGGFAAWATAMGAYYCGIESIIDLVNLGKEKGFNTHYNKSPLSDIIEASTVDLVVAFDVFEHLSLEQLRLMLKDIYVRMREGGVLLFRVPSGDSPFSRSIQYGDLTHRLVLGSSALQQLAASTGFEVISVRSPAFPLWGLGVIKFVRRSIVSILRHIIYPIISNILMNGGKPVLTPNMVCAFRKP